MNVVPGETLCFACVFGRPGRRTSGQSLESEREKGLLLTITCIMASLQVSQAIKLLLGDDTTAGITST
jgi:molybdopterin/thiamine biosynthesis adenylyltransferase